MEVKINREIMQYSESMFLGLSLRQFVCSALAVAAAVSVYYIFKDSIGNDIRSMLCMISALPFALLGFFRYHGMSAEKFALQYIWSEILERKIYVSAPRNIYMELIGE